MEEFDKQYVFVDITQVQKVSGWGLEAQIKHEITEEGVSFEALGFGGDTRHIFDWGSTSIRGKGPHEIAPAADTTLTLIVSNETMTLPDTAWLDVSKTASGYDAILHTSGGSWRNYVGGFEVLLDDYDDLFQTDDILLDAIPHNMQTRVVTDQYPEIFNWLEMLDLNVIIIISLMIFISVINMTSALLIIILERTRMIGLLKALGTQNSSLVRIFLRNAGVVIGIGLIVGNVIGIGLAWIQKSFGVIKLDPVNYFVETAPIKLDFTSFILLDLLTLLICVILLILPSLYVGTISPVRAIRFD
jgi:lipoprotein-releasing system permease protein